MKTSLNIADYLFKLAKKRALEEGKTLSEIISTWAELGQKVEADLKKQRSKVFQARSLGQAKVALTSREHWMEQLDDRD